MVIGAEMRVCSPFDVKENLIVKIKQMEKSLQLTPLDDLFLSALSNLPFFSGHSSLFWRSPSLILSLNDTVFN